MRCITALLLASCGVLAAAEDGFVPLFNGKDLTGWEAPTGSSVEDGILTLAATTAPVRARWTAGEVDDFALQVEFQVSGAPANLAFRATPELERQAIPLPTREGWHRVLLQAAGDAVSLTIDGTVQPPFPSAPPEPGHHAQGFLGITVGAGGTIKIREVSLKRLPLAEHRKKIVLIAGKNSHPLGEHEFEAGISAFRHALDKTPGVIAADYYTGWPTDPTAFANADAVLLYADGGNGNPAIQGDHLATLQALTAKGVGLGVCHYAVEVPATKGGNEFLAMIGGFYESKVSANPIWTIAPAQLPAVELTRGVSSFSTKDEWYFNLHFRPEMAGITSILTGIPSDQVRANRYSGSGPYDHIKAANGRTETLMWTVENPGANRGFGFTGGHFHANWANPDVRKLVLNAALWIAHADLPANGVDATLTDGELNSRLRKKPAK